MIYENAILFACDGLVKTSHKLYFHYQQYPWHLLHPENNPDDCEHQRRVQRRILGQNLEISPSCHLSGNYILGIAPFASNYYHFITDLVDCLATGPKWPILLPENMPRHYVDFLHFCNFPTLFLPPKVYRVENLLIPPYNGWSVKKVVGIRQFILQKLPESLSSQPSRRIYISRKLVQKRHLRNEEEFWPYLEKYGFEKIYLENLSVVDQIQLIRNTSHLIAPHGSGLINLIFSSYHTKILEIRPTVSSGQFCYEQLFSNGWTHYQYLVPPKRAHFLMPIAELEQILRQWFGHL